MGGDARRGAARGADHPGAEGQRPRRACRSRSTPRARSRTWRSRSCWRRWAADLDAAAGTGIDTLHVWAYPATGGAPVFVGTPTLGGVRPDVAAVHGEQFRESGFGLSCRGSSPGTYDLAVFPWSNVAEPQDFTPHEPLKPRERVYSRDVEESPDRSLHPCGRRCSRQTFLRAEGRTDAARRGCRRSRRRVRQRFVDFSVSVGWRRNVTSEPGVLASRRSRGRSRRPAQAGRGVRGVHICRDSKR